jgi:uncharacterized membrane protein
LGWWSGILTYRIFEIILLLIVLISLYLGLTYAKADSNHVTSVETEKTVIASIGYSLGAIAVKASYADVTDYQGIASNDGKQFRLLMLTNF